MLKLLGLSPGTAGQAPPRHVQVHHRGITHSKFSYAKCVTAGCSFTSAEVHTHLSTSAPHYMQPGISLQPSRNVLEEALSPIRKHALLKIQNPTEVGCLKRTFPFSSLLCRVRVRPSPDDQAATFPSNFGYTGACPEDSRGSSWPASSSGSREGGTRAGRPHKSKGRPCSRCAARLGASIPTAHSAPAAASLRRAPPVEHHRGPPRHIPASASCRSCPPRFSSFRDGRKLRGGEVARSRLSAFLRAGEVPGRCRSAGGGVCPSDWCRLSPCFLRCSFLAGERWRRREALCSPQPAAVRMRMDGSS